ncbi:MAG: lytic murein transglycosylase [bacterium]|nr:lytic murein transglycosylase [bacterium]
MGTRPILLFFVLFLVFFLNTSHFVFAQATSDDVLKRRAQLEEDLGGLEKRIVEQQTILQEKQRESVSLERDIAILDAKIQSAELSIRARDLTIKQLGADIGNKTEIIGNLRDKLTREKESLAQLLRKTREIDSFSLAEVILANKNISDFFVDVDSFNAIQAALSDSFEEIAATKNKTQEEKTALEEKRQEEQELRSIQELQKRRIEEDKGQKREILKISKGTETIYKNIIASIEKDATAIRTELFVLQGTDAIPFERALELANTASQKTGVRPALILGVIAEESNLGANVGKGNWRTDMKKPRDTEPFLDITRRLGLNPDSMPVSKKPGYGWGGAMGPAQFIPSTWILYEARIAKLTGHNPPNPWDPYDAFIASALLMKDNGADKGTYAAERLAALRYFAGWVNATKRAYAFYGDDVMVLAEKYQKQIDILQRN